MFDVIRVRYIDVWVFCMLAHKGRPLKAALSLHILGWFSLLALLS